MTSTLHAVKRWLMIAGAMAPVVIGGCTAFEPSNLPLGAVPMEAPPQFQEWWARTEHCSGLTGSMAEVAWFVVPNAASFQTDLGEKVGLWVKTEADAKIILAGDYAQHELVVRHEMLHQLLKRTGHPEEYFIERCGLTWERWQVAGNPMLLTSAAR